MGATHDYLVARARRWLMNTRKCGLVLTEGFQFAGERPDAIGWYFTGYSVLVECKASRADFVADKRKRLGHDRFGHPVPGMGQERWYMTPAHLLLPRDIPEGWGLLEVQKTRCRVVVKAASPGHYRSKDSIDLHRLLAEWPVLYSAWQNRRAETNEQARREDPDAHQGKQA